MQTYRFFTPCDLICLDMIQIQKLSKYTPRCYNMNQNTCIYSMIKCSNFWYFKVLSLIHHLRSIHYHYPSYLRWMMSEGKKFGAVVITYFLCVL